MAHRQLTLVLAAALLVTSACCSADPGLSPTAGIGSSSVPAAFTLVSPAVRDGKLLPEFRCEHKLDDVEPSIPLAWSGVPVGTGSLVVAMHHHPFPGDTSRVSSYLLLWGIDPSITAIGHGEAADGPWFMGSNKDGTAVSYTSPCSRGSGTHEYTITVYALSGTPPALPRQSTVEVTYPLLMEAISMVTVLDTATLTFTDTTP